MARGINKVILIGNLGNAPDCRSNQAGTLFANLSVATDESYKDKQTGQMVPRTEWHRVIFAGRLAEIAQQYLHKGSKVYVEGRLQTRKWQNQQGQDQYTTEIRGFEMQMLDGKQDGAPQEQRQPAQQQRPTNAGNQRQAPQQEQEDFDDDSIPF